MSAPRLGIQASLHVIDRAANESPFGFKDEYEMNEWALLGSGDILLLYTDGVSEHADDRYFPERLEDQTAQGEARVGSRDMRGDPRRHACVQCAGRRHHAGDRQARVEACGDRALHGFQRRAAPDPPGPVIRRHAVIGGRASARSEGKLTDPGLSDAQVLQILDRGPHLSSVPPRPVVVLRQPRNTGAPSHGDQLDHQMLRAVVLAQGQEPLRQGDRGKLVHARPS